MVMVVVLGMWCSDGGGIGDVVAVAAVVVRWKWLVGR